MFSETKPWMRNTIYAWTAAVVVFIYIPIVVIIMASFVKSRFFRLPVRAWETKWYEEALTANLMHQLHLTSFYIAGSVAILSVILGFFGALAFARYEWKGRHLYQKLLMVPIFFPQAVLGLALLLWFTFLGIIPTWHTAIIAHLVWIAPIVTLVISIQVYGYDTAQEEAAFDLGANRFQVLREVTLPALAPGLLSGALFAFLLSWVNFSLSTYTTGADNTVTEWLYAKMIVGYTPLVPALGALSVYGSIIILVVGYLVYRARARSKAASS